MLLLSRMAVAATGGAGLLVVLLLKKTKPKVRVTENTAEVEGYGLVVQVKMRNGVDGEVMEPALFDLDIENRSKSKQTFVH